MIGIGNEEKEYICCDESGSVDGTLQAWTWGRRVKQKKMQCRAHRVNRAHEKSDILVRDEG